MGIFGLYNFIKDNYSKYLKRTELFKKRIVFAGQNIVFSLIRSTVSKDSFDNGGNYDSVAAVLDKFITKLRRCKIEAIFVFDGINTLEYERWQQVKRRKAENPNGILKKVESKEVGLHDNTKGSYQKIFPSLLVVNVALSILRKANVTILQADEDAHRDIVAIARELNCLILAGNTDFFLYDVPGVFYSYSPGEGIPANWIDDGDTLSVVEWCAEDFRREQGLTKYDMALLGAVPSYFYAEGQYMDCQYIFESVKNIKTLPDLKKEKVIFDQFKVENADIFKPKTKTDFEAFKQKVQGCLNSDINSESDSKKHKYLLSKTACLLTAQEKLLPEKYQELWRRCELPPYLAIVLCAGKLKLPFLLQNLNMPSAYECSRAIRQVSYAIMLQYDYEGQGCPYPLEFYRHGVSFVEFTNEPVFRLSDFGEIPSLENIQHMSDLDRKNLFFASLSTSLDIALRMSLQDDVQMFLAVLRHWSNNSTATIFHIQAMILCFIKTRLMDQFFQNDDKCAVDTFKCTTAYMEEVQHQFNQIYEPIYSVQDEITFGERIAALHPFSELQAVLLDAMQLNQLLLSPFGDFLVQHYFCATFLVSMTVLLRDERVNIQRLLKNDDGEFLWDLFERCKEVIR